MKRALPCIRLKEMRMGMQDYEYMWLLKEAGKADVADTVTRHVIHCALQESGAGGFGDKFFGPGKWERDPAKWSAARLEMAEAILAAKSAPAPQPTPEVSERGASGSDAGR